MRKHIIKKYSGLFLTLLVGSTTLSSCHDDLFQDPQSEISERNFYKNADDINLALIGTYNSLQGLMAEEWIVTEVRSDNTQVTPDASEAKDVLIRNLDFFVANSLNEHVENYWRAAYRTIALANDVLDNIEVVTDEQRRKQYEGEARFLRAHAYFNLVRLWGGVFIVDHSMTGTEAVAKQYKRSSEAAVYEFLLNDLALASEMMSDVTIPGNQKGRVTQWVAKALWAKALLTVKRPGDAQKAEQLLRGVVTLSGHALQPTYASVFNVNNELNSEILFAVRYTSGNLGLGSPFANMFAPLNSENYVVTGNGRAFNYPSVDITNAFLATDGVPNRKNVSMAESWTGSGGRIFNFKYVKKYMSPFDIVNDAENDWPVIRYSDVLLLLAEAINESKRAPDAEAIGLLNQVHRRAVPGEEPYSLGAHGTYYNFIMALARERRVEFAFENQRWFDLLRLGLAKAVINAHFQAEPYYNNPSRPAFNARPINDWQLVLPIPQFEIDVNPNVTQNIGY